MGLADGKVCLVTGGGSGIGEATVVTFAAEGAAAVVVVDRDGDAAQRVAADTASTHPDVETLAVTADVTDDDAVAAAVAAAVERFGRLDAASNNAGISGGYAPIAEMALEEWDQILAVNLRSVFSCLRHELRAMAVTGGAIVNAASGAGLVGTPGQAGYVASKHGVLGLTKTAAMEAAASGIRVNAVCPGLTRTPMVEGFLSLAPDLEQKMTRITPMRRLGEAGEVAAAVVWLCSDAASFVNGHSLVVDGGAISR